MLLLHDTGYGRDSSFAVSARPHAVANEAQPSTSQLTVCDSFSIFASELDIDTCQTSRMISENDSYVPTTCYVQGRRCATTSLTKIAACCAIPRRLGASSVSGQQGDRWGTPDRRTVGRKRQAPRVSSSLCVNSGQYAVGLSHVERKSKYTHTHIVLLHDIVLLLYL